MALPTTALTEVNIETIMNVKCHVRVFIVLILQFIM